MGMMRADMVREQDGACMQSCGGVRLQARHLQQLALDHLRHFALDPATATAHQ